MISLIYVFKSMQTFSSFKYLKLTSFSEFNRRNCHNDGILVTFSTICRCFHRRLYWRDDGFWRQSPSVNSTVAGRRDFNHFAAGMTVFERKIAGMTVFHHMTVTVFSHFIDDISVVSSLFDRMMVFEAIWRGIDFNTKLYDLFWRYKDFPITFAGADSTVAGRRHSVQFTTSITVF